MAKLGSISLKGASGNTYEFEVYPFDTTFNALGAVYYVTNRTENLKGIGSHTGIYVGETENLKERFDDHHKHDCFVQHDANAICVHIEDDSESRLQKESDIIQKKNPPCNG